jgi:hypothetical protein
MFRNSMSTRATLWVSAFASIVALAACGGGGNASTSLTGTGGTNSTGSAGNVDQTGTGGSSTGGTTGASGSTGTGGVSATGTAGQTGAGVAVCSNYCMAIMANCTGTNQQYSDMANCMKICSYMPAGTPTDRTVDSVGCRTNSANDAKTDPSKCWFAGPLSDGACGNDCNTFCNVATQYCGASVGYQSFDDCNSICSQYQRVIPPATDGQYSAMYTPGTMPETQDTLECRAYYLFIEALASTTAQTMDCPYAANMSAKCGSGVVVLSADAGTTTSDAAVPAYDGGVVNIINSTNWNETKYPPTSRKMLLRDEGDPHMVMIDLSKTPILQWKTVAEGPWARAEQLIGGNQILGGTSTGYQVFDFTSGMITKTVKGFGNTQSAYRMVTGETMLTTSGTVLKFLDKNDQMTRQISYPGYGYVRVARPTRKGTFLVPSDTKLFEGDATGKVLWSTTGAQWGHVWMPLMLGPSVGGGMWNDGDTLLCTAFGSSCDVVDQVKHTVGFRFGTKNMAMAAAVRPNFFSEYEILPNGNIFTANWQGHGGGNGGSGIQVLEFDPTGKLVWFWKQDPTIFSSIQGVQSMDGKDPQYLYVQETSSDSTWQPVMTNP